MKQTCFVCQNVDCQSRGSEKLMKELSDQVAAGAVDAEVKPYICFGGCDFGPNIVVHPQKLWYAGRPTRDREEPIRRPRCHKTRHHRSVLERDRLLAARYRRVLIDATTRERLLIVDQSFG